MRTKKVAQRVLLRIADMDQQKMVHNPNPRGVQEMVTLDYAQRFLNHGKPAKKPEQKAPAQQQAPQQQVQNKTHENRQRVEEQRQKNVKHVHALEHPEFNKKGSEVSREDCVKFIQEFKKTFDSTKNWEQGFIKAGAKHFAGRLKDEGSLHEKMQTRFKDRALRTAGDIVGTRAVCKNLADMKKVIEHIYATHHVVEHDDSVDLNQRKEGYRAHHFTIKTDDGKLVELQVKTENQQAWSGYTHDNIYKASDPQIKAAKPEIDKYTKELSDYIYAIDSGKQPDKKPVAPKILKDKGLEFNLDALKAGESFNRKPKASQRIPAHARIFKHDSKTEMLLMSELHIRKSPSDAVSRAHDYAIQTMNGQFEKREPITVWKVKKHDGSYYYSVRDGNTTAQMLKENGWKILPAHVEKEIEESKLPPVAEHVPKGHL